MIVRIWDKIHNVLAADHCFENDYAGKRPVVWKEHCAEYWSKNLWKSMQRCRGRRDSTEIMLKTALLNTKSIRNIDIESIAKQKSKRGLNERIYGKNGLREKEKKTLVTTILSFSHNGFPRNFCFLKSLKQ